MMNEYVQSNDYNTRLKAFCCEKQLAYLVKLINSLYSYGLPSSQSKLPLKHASFSVGDFKILNRYDDLTIISRFIYVMKILNQIKK